MAYNTYGIWPLRIGCYKNFKRSSDRFFLVAIHR